MEKMSDAEKRARTVPPSVPEDQRQEVVDRATSRIEYNAWLDKVQTGVHSPTLEEYVRWSQYDGNLSWWLPSSDIQNLLATAIERLETAGLLVSEDHCGGCWRCWDETKRKFPLIFLCPDCGDGRCARALDHREECDNARALTEERA